MKFFGKRIFVRYSYQNVLILWLNIFRILLRVAMKKSSTSSAEHFTSICKSYKIWIIMQVKCIILQTTDVKTSHLCSKIADIRDVWEFTFTHKYEGRGSHNTQLALFTLVWWYERDAIINYKYSYFKESSWVFFYCEKLSLVQT